MQERVLIVDDDQAVRASLRRYLQKHGFAVAEADSCRSAEARFRTFAPSVALIDYRLPDGEAITLLPRLRHIDPSCTLFVLTGHGTIDLAVRAVKEGAAEFLTKPVDMPSLLRAVQIGARASRTGLSRARIIEPLFGEGRAMRALKASLDALRGSDDDVLLVGEEGTGRSTLARWIHATSERAGAAFVEFDGSPDAAERDLFGVESSGGRSRPGVLEAIEGGTLFIEAIDGATPSCQRELAELVVHRRFRRVGAAIVRQSNVRIVASSNTPLVELALEDAPADGERFNGALAAWFSPRTVLVPALRDRGEDVVRLARHLIVRLGPRHRRGALELTPEAEEELRAYAWPGNVRELENVLESAILAGSGPRVGRGDLPIERRASPLPAEPLTLEEIQRRTIYEALREEHGRVEKAARRLGIPRSTLYYKLKAMGLGSRPALWSKSTRRRDPESR
jgi:DNA-binding NtrC family response regulator